MKKYTLSILDKNKHRLVSNKHQPALLHFKVENLLLHWNNIDIEAEKMVIRWSAFICCCMCVNANVHLSKWKKQQQTFDHTLLIVVTFNSIILQKKKKKLVMPTCSNTLSTLDFSSLLWQFYQQHTLSAIKFFLTFNHNIFLFILAWCTSPSVEIYK